MTDASEGDVNTSPLRATWDARRDAGTRDLLEIAPRRSSCARAPSTPCLDALVNAEGGWLTPRRPARLLDFHGNSVYQFGHVHPDVVAAIKAQFDTLAFCPRRFYLSGAAGRKAGRPRPRAAP